MAVPNRVMRKTAQSHLRATSAVLAAALTLWCAPLLAQETVLVEFGSQMSYVSNTEPPPFGMTWVDPAFDDSGWSAGQYGVGFEADSGAEHLLLTTVPPTARSVFTRATFNLADAGQVQNMIFGADYDDGYAVWINGVDVFRSSNMPDGELLWWTLAEGEYESSNLATPAYRYHDISAAALPELVTGDNILAVAVWNILPTSDDLVMVPQLVINRELSLVRGPYLQMGTPDSVVVRWRTSVAAGSRVEYGSAPGSLTEVVEDPAPKTEHSITLTSLDADTLYYYSVGTPATVLAGDDADHFFLTSPISGTAKPTRIWILGDPGYGTADALAVRDAYYTYAGPTHTDLWLMLGDNAMSTGIDSQFQTKMFDVYHEMLRKSVLWPTIGNHDAATASSSNQSGPYYEVFTLPAAGEAGGEASGTEAYYSFDYANIHFVVMDSHETDRALGSPMLTWLESDLDSTVQDWIIAYFHHPPYTKGSHDSDVDTRPIEMRENVLPILEDHGVDLVFSGHSHSYERSFLLDGHYHESATFGSSHLIDGGDGRGDGDGVYFKPTLGPAPHEGTVYTVAGSAGNTSGGPLDHPAMYISWNELGSVVLDVDGGRLDSLFLDSTGQILDYFTLAKGSSPFAPGADFAAEPAVGTAPLAVDFSDISINVPTSWAWDFDNDGGTDSDLQHPSHTYDQPGRYSVRLAVSNAVGSDEELKLDSICVLSTQPDEVTGLNLDANRIDLHWDPYPAVQNYDVVRGDLIDLRATGGNFGSAQRICLLDDGEDETAEDHDNPGAGEAFFYLARATSCARRTGSFDTTGPGQAAARDLDLQGAGAQCGCDLQDDQDSDGYCNGFDDCTDSDDDSYGDPGFPLNICPTDNCPSTPNGDQADADSDGLGNVCDDCPLDAANDADGDTVCGDADNCPAIPNAGQLDQDTDGMGDPCDDCPFDAENDIDSDTVCGDVDNCPATANTDQLDQDSDGLGTVCDDCPFDAANDIDSDTICGDVDNCPLTPNTGQSDLDSDDLGDPCDDCQLDPDNDADGDTICGDVDNCPMTFNDTQGDRDSDDVGDLCDNCPEDLNTDQADMDLDLSGDACDNCRNDFNLFQLDDDSDGAGNICDSCPQAYDPSQLDSDLDGAGNYCDCQPQDPTDRRPQTIESLGLYKNVLLETVLEWSPLAQADAYSVMRGNVVALSTGGYGECQAEGLGATIFVDADSPVAEECLFYLVQPQNLDCGLGSLGFGFDESERANSDPSACTGVLHSDAYATGETTVLGTATGTLALTLSSDDSLEAIEEERTPGSPLQRMSHLEHHWNFTVAAGVRIELHVEGIRTESIDGDDFVFEYSTDGGSMWHPIAMDSLPYSDTDVDLVGALPSSLSGAVTIRVIDTDRVIGHQARDTVSIDELFVRTILE
jgi:PKD repeat protein